MAFRTVYLTQGPRAAGRSHFAGRLVYEALRQESEDVLLGWGILGEEWDDEPLHPNARDDMIKHETFRNFAPDVVYIEGGLFAGGGDWRAPRELLTHAARHGAVVFVTDVDYNQFVRYKAAYRDAADFLGASADYGTQDRGSPVYGLTRSATDSDVMCFAAKMWLSEWLRPVYRDVESILVWRPVLIHPHQHELLATCDPATTDLYQDDLVVDEIHPCAFATVNSLGDGYIVLVAASFSDDTWVRECPGNARWVINVARLLRSESNAEADRRAPLRRLQDEVLRARGAAVGLDGDDAGNAYATVLDPALKQAASSALKREVADDARNRLEQHFDAAWPRLGRHCQDSLILADVLRTDLEQYASDNPSFDFAVAVHAYSRALESEVLEKLFAPLRGSHEIPLPHDTDEPTKNQSLAVLRALRADQMIPTLGAMGQCLRNVGCRMAGVEGNGFALMLDAILRDREGFCRSFPKQLIKYTAKFRNAAAHVGRMSLEECVEARAVLLDEPNSLLVYLAEQLHSADG